MKLNIISPSIKGPFSLGMVFWKDRDKRIQLKLNALFFLYYLWLLYISIFKDGLSFKEALGAPVLITFVGIIFSLNFLSFVYFIFYYYLYKHKFLEVTETSVIYRDSTYEVDFIKLDKSKILIYQKNRIRHFDVWCSDSLEAKRLFDEIIIVFKFKIAH